MNNMHKLGMVIFAVIILFFFIKGMSGNTDNKEPEQPRIEAQSASSNSEQTTSAVTEPIPTVNQRNTQTQNRQKYLEIMIDYEGQILDVFKNEIGSDIFDELGNHQIALRIKSGRDKLVDIKAKTISVTLPDGVETAHTHFISAIDLYIEAARKFQEGVEFSDVSVLKNASAIKSQAWDEQTVAWKLLGIN